MILAWNRSAPFWPLFISQASHLSNYIAFCVEVETFIENTWVERLVDLVLFFEQTWLILKSGNKSAIRYDIVEFRVVGVASNICIIMHMVNSQYSYYWLLPNHVWSCKTIRNPVIEPYLHITWVYVAWVY